FHYVLFGTIVFAAYAGVYFWFPKMTGRYMDEKLGKLHFWLTFVGFHTTFLVQHWLGEKGMPRRIADYLPSDGFTTLNTISTIGSPPERTPGAGTRRPQRCGVRSPAARARRRASGTASRGTEPTQTRRLPDAANGNKDRRRLDRRLRRSPALPTDAVLSSSHH